MPGLEGGVGEVIRGIDGWRLGISTCLRRIVGGSGRPQGVGVEIEKIVLDVEELEPVFHLPTVGAVSSGGSSPRTRVGTRLSRVVLGQKSEEGFRTEDGGTAAPGVFRDLSVAGDDGESSRRRGSPDQMDDQFIGGRPGAGESNVDPSIAFDAMWFRDPVTDEKDLVAIETTSRQERGEFLEIDSGKFRRKNADHMQHVVGVDQSRHEGSSIEAKESGQISLGFGRKTCRKSGFPEAGPIAPRESAGQTPQVPFLQALRRNERSARPTRKPDLGGLGMGSGPTERCVP